MGHSSQEGESRQADPECDNPAPNAAINERNDPTGQCRNGKQGHQPTDFNKKINSDRVAAKAPESLLVTVV